MTKPKTRIREYGWDVSGELKNTEASEVSSEDGKSCGRVDNLEVTLGTDEESWPGDRKSLNMCSQLVVNGR